LLLGFPIQLDRNWKWLSGTLSRWTNLLHKGTKEQTQRIS